MTGSTTSFSTGHSARHSATILTPLSSPRAPVLAARARASDESASNWARIRGFESTSMAETPRVFCAVIRVTIDVPCTPQAENVFRSACNPAPPPLSLPAIVSAIGNRPSSSGFANSDRKKRSKDFVIRGARVNYDAETIFYSAALLIDLLAGLAKSSFAIAEVRERLEQPGLIEIWPHHIGYVNLAIGNLPEQEVADAKLTAGSNHKVGVGPTAGIKMAAEGGFVNIVGLKFARPHRLGNFARGGQNLLAPAITHGDLQEHAGILLACHLKLFYRASHAFAERLAIANYVWDSAVS